MRVKRSTTLLHCSTDPDLNIILFDSFSVFISPFQVSISRTTRDGQRQELRHGLDDEWLPMAKALSSGDTNRAFHAVAKVRDVKSEIEDKMKTEISNECDQLCSKESPTLFKMSSLDDVLGFSPIDQDEELKERAPLMRSFLMTAVCNHRQLSKNKRKNLDSVAQGAMTAAGMLLHCRSSHMNAHQMMTAVQLKEGLASKRTFQRLHRRHLSSSYAEMLEFEQRSGNDEVEEWQALDESDEEEELDKGLVQAAEGTEGGLNHELNGQRLKRHTIATPEDEVNVKVISY